MGMVMSSDALKRYKCKWCQGTGFVSSGDRCRSCSGRGWYERSFAPRATRTLGIVAGLLALVFLWMGQADSPWRIVPQGLSVSSVGAAVLCAAIQLRGPEEEGHNLLMLLGTLLVVGGILSIPARALL